ncbi:glycosyltransferase family 2 protein [Histidinibacterium aquaticum]|uniref:Glycosyltransferase family 2 protein n=1 Tax=Histidinibacterium aquaticum TaxID=2613962 RepID=A0A5J5GMJ7_9RHOB|nr:glycosyltransferase family 2 protein [Histidinibacterium aquaticum]KAA9008913.1 glycosyltransferase family 2 protein [Histidinibacterium aquaticum]
MSLLRVLQGKTRTQGRWRARLWRWRRPEAEPSDDPLVLFALPLVSRRRASDWARVEENLRGTLEAFRRQSDPNWRAVICGQDRPALPEDDRIDFIEAKVGDKFYDKGDKRRQLIAQVARTVRRDLYYMQHDADDILHPDVVAHIRKGHNGRGYLIDRGYFVHAGTRRLAPLFPPERPFHKTCGSSAAVYADFREHRLDARLLYEHRSHTQVAGICEDWGRPLEPIPFAAGLYMVGHGENMIERRGKLEQRLGYLDANEITDPAEREEILRAFGL